MRAFTLMLVLAGIAAGLSAANWQTITNTSHVYDLMLQDDQVYFSTWGGVVQAALPVGANAGFSELVQQKVWTTADGIASNDVRNLEYIGLTGTLWFGSAFNGISIVTPGGVQQLNTGLGLPSNRVVKIIEHGSEVLVATGSGLSSFYYLEGVNFPLMLYNYTNQNTGGGLLSNEIEAMVLAPNNYLYISTTAGLNFVHLDSLAVDQAWRHFPPAELPSGYVNKLSVNGNKLAVAYYNSVYLHSSDPWQGGWEMVNTTGGILNSAIAGVCLDDANSLWVSYGTWNEDFLTLSRDIDTLMTSIDSQGNVKHWAEFEAGLRDKSISRIVSQNGKIYLCSWGDGIFLQESDNQWTQFIPNSIGFPKVRAISSDHNHAAWFSSGDLNHLPLRKSALGASKWLNGQWHTYNIANSPIHSDNILTVAIDSHNRKWFGTYDVVPGESPVGWLNGLTVWDETTDEWKHFTRWGVRTWNHQSQTWNPFIPDSPTLQSNTIGHIAMDQNNNMFVSGYDRGFSVFDPEDNLIAEFMISNSVYQRTIYSYHNGRQYFFGTNNDRGLVIWNHNSIPETAGEHWLVPAPAELSNCEVYGVVTVESPYEGIQHWIAVSNGLYMWNEQNWYKYDTSIKRFIYNTGNGLWENDLLYYVDEERLYGSVRTTPTAIYLDPFDRIWIGSLDNGISMYNPRTEHFTNYFVANSPLLTNHITALGYDPVEGLLLIGTPDGLNTLRIGRSIKPPTTLQTLKAFPNPFYPNGSNTVQIVNQPPDVMPAGKNNCRIYDSSGALVIKLEENEFSRFAWNGENSTGKKCSSGIYFFVVTDAEGNTKKGKIALIR